MPPTHGATALYGSIARRAALGALSPPALNPLFGVLKRNPSKTRGGGGGVSALGGRRLVGKHISQPNVGGRVRGDVGEEARPWWNVCVCGGGVGYHLGAAN